MKKYFLASTLLLTFFILSTSFALTNKPKKCPSETALKNSHFNFATPQGEKGWVVADLQNKYDTDDSWTFLMFDIKGESEEEAIKIARNDVKNLTFSEGPIEYAQKDRWACIYQSTAGNYAASFTPLIPAGEI